MWRRVYLVWTDVSEERMTSILRVEKSASEEPTWAGDWRLQRYVPPKRRFTQDLHSATSRKMACFVVTAVKTSNLISIIIICAWYLTGDDKKQYLQKLPFEFCINHICRLVSTTDDEAYSTQNLFVHQIWWNGAGLSVNRGVRLVQQSSN
jgi:hypothetical protein